MKLHPVFSMGAVLTSRVVGAAAAVMTLLVLTRELSPEGVGLFVSVQSAAALGALFAVLNLDGAAIRVLPGLKPDESGTVHTFLGYLGRHAIVILPLTALAGAAWVMLTMDGGLVVFLLAVATICVTAALRIAASVNRALGDVQGTAVVALAVRPWLLAIAIGLIAVAGGLSANNALLAGVVTVAICALILLQRLLRRMPERGTSPVAKDPAKMARWRQTGLVLMFAAIFTEEFQNIVLLVTGAFAAEAEVARLAVLLRIVALMRMIPVAASTAFGIDIAVAVREGRIADAAAIVSKGARLSVLLAVPAAIAASLLAEFGLAFFGEIYRQDAGLLPILVVTIVISSVAGPCLAFLAAAGDNRSLIIVTAVTVTALIGLVALTAPIGLHAVVWALLVTQLLWDGGLLLALRLKHGVMPWALAPVLAPSPEPR